MKIPFGFLGTSGPRVVSASPSVLLNVVSVPSEVNIALSEGGTGATAASVNGVALTGITVLSDTLVACTLPAGTYALGLGEVTLTSPSSPQPLANGFRFAANPVISSLSQQGGRQAGGTVVTITGTGFAPNMVFEGGGLGTLAYASPTQATWTTAAQASPGAVSVAVSTYGGFVSNSVSFTFLPAPGTVAVVPSSGPIAEPQSATFTASDACLPHGLAGVAWSVTVGGAAVTGGALASATVATGTIPAGGSPGPADVVVTVDGVSATTPGAYTFSSAGPPPMLTGINIDFASANGGESRVLTGANLAGATVTVDGVSATVTAPGSTSLTFTVPPSAVSTTNGNPSASTVTVATSGGSASLGTTPGNSLWYVPAYYGVAATAVYSAQSVTTSGGNVATVPDLTGNGYTATPLSVAPAYSATGGGFGGTLPYWTSALGNDNRMVNSSFPAGAINGTVVLFCRVLTSFGNWAVYSLNGPGSFYEYIVGYLSTLNQYNGQTANPVTLSVGSDFDVVSVYNGASSVHYLNGVPTSGGDPGSDASSPGLCIGGYYPESGFFPAMRFMFAAQYAAVLSPTAAANFNAYFTNQG